MAEVVELLLPEAPSANTYWRRHGHVIHVSAAAKAYKQAVAMLASRYKNGSECAFPSGDLSVVVVWHRSAKRGDLPNRTKVLYDALEGSVYANDRQIAQEWTMRCDEHPTIPKGYVRVEVSRVAAPVEIVLPDISSIENLRHARKPRSRIPAAQG